MVPLLRVCTVVAVLVERSLLTAVAVPLQRARSRCRDSASGLRRLTASPNQEATVTSNSLIQRFLDSVTDPTVGFADVFSSEAVLDATVPHWRFTARGEASVLGTLGEWYAHPGTFDSVSHVDLPDGALVQFDLSWEEDGRPFAAHQAHVLTVSGDRITRDIVFCGGRWSASELAEMEAASLSDA